MTHLDLIRRRSGEGKGEKERGLRGKVVRNSFGMEEAYSHTQTQTQAQPHTTHTTETELAVVGASGYAQPDPDASVREGEAKAKFKEENWTPKPVRRVRGVRVGC